MEHDELHEQTILNGGTDGLGIAIIERAILRFLKHGSTATQNNLRVLCHSLRELVASGGVRILAHRLEVTRNRVPVEWKTANPDPKPIEALSTHKLLGHSDTTLPPCIR